MTNRDYLMTLDNKKISGIYKKWKWGRKLRNMFFYEKMLS